jgi:hypothetical protein
MKNSMSLEATLDQLVSDFTQALIEAALHAPLSEFAAATGPYKVQAKTSPFLAPPPRKQAGDERSTRPSTRPTAISSRVASLPPARLSTPPSAPGAPLHGEEGGSAHAITDPALLLRAIDNATTSSPEPPAPSRSKRAVPALLETREAEAPRESTLRAGEEVLRRTGGGMVFRRVQPGRTSQSTT